MPELRALIFLLLMATFIASTSMVIVVAAATDGKGYMATAFLLAHSAPGKLMVPSMCGAVKLLAR